MTTVFEMSDQQKIGTIAAGVVAIADQKARLVSETSLDVYTQRGAIVLAAEQAPNGPPVRVGFAIEPAGVVHLAELLLGPGHVPEAPAVLPDGVLVPAERSTSAAAPAVAPARALTLDRDFMRPILATLKSTGVLVEVEGGASACDVALLDRESLATWLRSEGPENAYRMIARWLGHAEWSSL